MAEKRGFDASADDSAPAGIRTDTWDQAVAAAARTLEGVTASSTGRTSPANLAEAVIARGYGRLYGGTQPATELPRAVIAPTAALLAERMSAAERDAAALPVTWSRAAPDEADALVARLLQARMDAWAATAELVAAVDGLDDAAVAAAFEDFEDAVDRFDRKLAGRADLLATLVGTAVLDGWRQQLALAHNDPLPWWLDGRLEARAEAMVRSVDRLARKSASADGRHEPAAGTLPSGHPLAAVRPVFVQEYAAAAEAGHSVEARQFRWRDAGGDFLAALLPPPRRAANPQAAIVEFTTVAGNPATNLVGRVAVLGACTSPIVPVGDAAVVARFPGDVLRGDGADAVLRLGLVSDEPWEAVVE